MATTNGVNGHAATNDFSLLKVNQDKLLDSIHTSCKWGAAHRYGDDHTETGMARLSLNNDDKLVRDWFVSTAKSLNCTVTTDKMGNLFAVRPGKNKNAPPVFCGSHLDTQPLGGRYDGILGVTAGLAVIRTLEENGWETEGSVGVVNWTNEEGARFPKMAVSSGVWAGAIPLEDAWSLEEIAPSGEDNVKKTMKQELERIGYLGDTEASFEAMPMAAHFELHVEQGPILEREEKKVGVVKSVQAFRWFEISIEGKGTHTATPMEARRDAMLCSAQLIMASNRIAKSHSGLATTGVLTSNVTSSTNTIASSLTMTLDVRHVSDSTLSQMVAEMRTEFDRIAKEECELGCTVSWKELVDSPAIFFDDGCISAVEASAKEAVAGDEKLWRYMVSGAGHDSCYTSAKVPTSMIFVPSKGGISHHPEEYTSPEDCALGAQVLLGAVLRYDQLRATRGDFK